MAFYLNEHLDSRWDTKEAYDIELLLEFLALKYFQKMGDSLNIAGRKAFIFVFMCSRLVIATFIAQKLLLVCN